MTLIEKFMPEVKVLTGMTLALGIDYVDMVGILLTDLTKQYLTDEIGALMLALKLIAMLGGALMVCAGAYSRILSIQMKRRALKRDDQYNHSSPMHDED